MSASAAAAAAAAAASLTTDPLAAEDLLLSWYSLYQPRPQPAAPGHMLAAMSTLMMPAAAVTLAGHPLAALPPQPKPQDLLTLPGPLPIAHLTLKAMNGHTGHQHSAANGLQGLAVGVQGQNLCGSASAATIANLTATTSNSHKAGNARPANHPRRPRHTPVPFPGAPQTRTRKPSQQLPSSGSPFPTYWLRLPSTPPKQQFYPSAPHHHPRLPASLRPSHCSMWLGWNHLNLLVA